MTSRSIHIGCLLAALVATGVVTASPSTPCDLAEQSALLGRAVTSDELLVVAISDDETRIAGAKVPAVAAKRELRSMFLRYCKEYSGFANLQVSSSGGITESAACGQKNLFIFWIPRSKIKISEIAAVDAVSDIEIPDFSKSPDAFRDFK